MKKNKDLTEQEIEELKKGPTKDINPYKDNSFFSRIPFAIKALVFKWWMYGVGVFFIFWGLSNLIGNDAALDSAGIIILSIVLSLFDGIILDVVVNHFIELMDSDKRQSKYFIFFHSKKVYSLFINILYSFFVTYPCVVIFENLNDLLNKYFAINISVEPIFTGLLLLGIDMLFILLKNIFVKLFNKIFRKDKENV